MSRIKSVLIVLAARVAGNRVVQAALRANVFASQYFMGIGAGSSVDASGEAGLFQALRSSGPGPYCIFDVGANQGQFLSLVWREVGEHVAGIHCFEPGQSTYRILQQRAPQDERITLNRLGLADKPGAVTLHYDAEGSGIASLTRRDLTHLGIRFDRSEVVPVDTLDEYCASHSVAQIDLLKIDVEGHELDVLKGAEGMLSRGAVRMVMFEFGGCNIDTRTYFKDFWQFFAARGMQLYRVTPSGYLDRIEHYDEQLEQFRTTNFVALRVMEARMAA